MSRIRAIFDSLVRGLIAPSNSAKLKALTKVLMALGNKYHLEWDGYDEDGYPCWIVG